MKILILASLLLTAHAFAGTATVSWTNPTAYVDGTPLAATDITQTRVEYGTCNGALFGTKAGEVLAAGAATSAIVNNLAPGLVCFQAKTTAKGQESAASVAQSKTIAQPAPNPPTLTSVAVAAFRVTGFDPTKGLIVGNFVGVVPLKTACSPLVPLMNGYYFVDHRKVKFFGNNYTSLVVVKCAMS